ncbi:putative [histone H3]-lysine(4) N-trimethyltransferase [Helianthus anomalus]
MLPYCCPECNGQFSFDQSVVDENYSKVSSCTESNDQSTLPDKISVVCTDVEGIYYPNLHLFSVSVVPGSKLRLNGYGILVLEQKSGKSALKSKI